MELDEISPAAVVAGAVGGAIGYFMSGQMEGIQLIWRVLTPILCAVGGFFIVQKMASD